MFFHRRPRHAQRVCTRCRWMVRRRWSFSPRAAPSAQRSRSIATGTYAGLTMQTPDEPVEAYVMQCRSLKPVRVSAANVDLPKQPLGETRVIQWKAKDGKEIEGLLTLPVNYDKPSAIR